MRNVFARAGLTKQALRIDHGGRNSARGIRCVFLYCNLVWRYSSDRNMFASLTRGADDDTLPDSTPTIPTDTIPIIFSFIHLTHTEYMYLSLINKTCYSELQKQIYWERAFTNYLGHVPENINNLKEQYMSYILNITAENRKDKETIKLVRLF